MVTKDWTTKFGSACPIRHSVDQILRASLCDDNRLHFILLQPILIIHFWTVTSQLSHRFLNIKMGKISRVTMFKLPKPEDQDATIEAYKKMFAEAKKVRRFLSSAN